MKAMLGAITAAALATFPAAVAAASQGPGTTGGGATATDKLIFAGVAVAALCVGAFFRLRTR